MTTPATSKSYTDGFVTSNWESHWGTKSQLSIQTIGRDLIIHRVSQGLFQQFCNKLLGTHFCEDRVEHLRLDNPIDLEVLFPDSENTIAQMENGIERNLYAKKTAEQGAKVLEKTAQPQNEPAKSLIQTSFAAGERVPASLIPPANSTPAPVTPPPSTLSSETIIPVTAEQGTKVLEKTALPQNEPEGPLIPTKRAPASLIPPASSTPAPVTPSSSTLSSETITPVNAEAGQKLNAPDFNVLQEKALRNELNKYELSNYASQFERGNGVPQDYQKAITLYQYAAAKGHDEALFSLGVMHEEGHGVPKDLAEAIKFYQRAATLGLDVAQYKLGQMYEHGRGVERDYSKALELYQKAANSNSDAAFSLGQMYEQGRGIPIDLASAASFYELAATRHNSSAQLSLGLMYLNGGDGIKQNYQEAIHWLGKAGEQRNADALFTLGLIYELGKGVEKDLTKAQNFYELAANLGESEALFKLGLMHEEGNGVTQDNAKALNFFKQAADKGHVQSQAHLGKIYEQKQYTIIAMKCYQKAAKQGNGSAQEALERLFQSTLEAAKFGNRYAQFDLAYLYEDGIGVAQDFSKAVEFYQQAGLQGFEGAFINLAVMYEQGAGVTQDLSKAVEFYEKAAELGDQEALNYLGQIYEKGRLGISKSVLTALEYYQNAAKLGSRSAQEASVRIRTTLENEATQGKAEAQNILGYIYQYGLGVNINYQQAINYYRAAAEKGYPGALCNLALMYEKGLGVAKDYNEAIKLYEQADEEGLYHLGYLHMEGLGVKQNLQIADAYFKSSFGYCKKRADQNNDPVAQFNVGYMFENGYGVKQDLEEARSYYQKAAAHGETDSKIRLKEMNSFWRNYE